MNQQLSIFSRVKRNHALEHATLHLVSFRGLEQRIAGISYWSGYLILGHIDTERVRTAAVSGLRALEEGQARLAIHPRCGGNLAAGSVVALVGSYISLEAFKKSWLQALGILASLGLSVLAAPRLGATLQEHVTTTSNLAGLTITAVDRHQFGRLTVHHVRTETPHA